MWCLCIYYVASLASVKAELERVKGEVQALRAELSRAEAENKVLKAKLDERSADVCQGEPYIYAYRSCRAPAAVGNPCMGRPDRYIPDACPPASAHPHAQIRKTDPHKRASAEQAHFRRRSSTTSG